jgi:hypothetical protein
MEFFFTFHEKISTTIILNNNNIERSLPSIYSISAPAAMTTTTCVPPAELGMSLKGRAKFIWGRITFFGTTNAG